MFESNAFERDCDSKIERTIAELCEQLDRFTVKDSEKDHIIEWIVKLRASLNPTVVIQK